MRPLPGPWNYEYIWMFVHTFLFRWWNHLYTRIISIVYFVWQCSNLFITCSFLSYYLKAVCYLNNHGEDYKGGILKFQDGDPSSIVPIAGVSKSTFTLNPCVFRILPLWNTCICWLGTSGWFFTVLWKVPFFQDVVIYTADNRNVHCVHEVHFCCQHFFFQNFSFLWIFWIHINSFMSCSRQLIVTYNISSSIIVSQISVVFLHVVNYFGKAQRLQPCCYHAFSIFLKVLACPFMFTKNSKMFCFAGNWRGKAHPDCLVH